MIANDEDGRLPLTMESSPNDAAVVGENNKQSIVIPRSTFTALRFLYATPEELNKSSKVVFLGTFPEQWIIKRSSSLISHISTIKDKKLNAFFDAAPAIVVKRYFSVSDKFDKLARKETSELSRSNQRNIIVKDDKSMVSESVNQAGESTSHQNGDQISKVVFKMKDDAKKIRLQKSRLQLLQASNKFQNSPISASEKNHHHHHYHFGKTDDQFLVRNIQPRPTNINPDIVVTGGAKKIRSAEERRFERMKKKTWKGATNIKEYLYEDQVELLKRVLRNYQVGELVKVQKMLVSVKLVSNPLSGMVSDSSSTDYRTLERWKEYFVAVRSTGNVQVPLLVQFHTDRTIRKHDERMVNGKSSKDVRTRNTSLDFLLNIKTCTVGFYNALDKSVAISVPSNEVEDGYRVYIFKGPSQFVCIEWYLFIKTSLGFNRDNRMKIRVPGLDLELEIEVAVDEYEEIIEESRNTQTLTLSFEEYGYRINNTTSVSYIIKLLVEKLTEIENDFIEISRWLKEATSASCKLGLAWKSYDRLSWVGEFDQNILWQYHAMSNTHTLELHIISNHPTSAMSTEGIFLQEPVRVEGFLWKLKHDAKKNMSKVLKDSKMSLKYYFSNKELLYFCGYSDALPPVPELYRQDSLETIFSKDYYHDLIEKIPAVYESCLYELDDNGHVKWLCPDSEDYKSRNLACLLDTKRVAYHLLKSQGAINLLEVDYVENQDETSMALVMHNGARLVLGACDLETKNEWIGKITQLSEYWKLRKEEDVSRIKYIRERNLSTLNITEHDEATFVEKAANWELKKGISDPQIYNINSLSTLKLVIYSGELYQKPRKHANFEKYYVVLAPGYLLIFKMFSRHKVSNVIYSNATYEHYMSIPLSSCYLYTGGSTASDLLHRDRNFDIMNPGHHALPKVYLDGWKCCEDETARCFTIWIGSKKLISKGKNQGSKIGRKTAWVNRLGREGRSMVFMARSRQQRDLWALNILNEIGRFDLGRGEEEFHVV
ncbi:Spo71 protein [Saccharomycopsis crataegensis]|uniref:Spo71 protein n=1 Tax=Saccharomycopsis crataegensis TaxID=43959 RepID=A0AAV5QID0_9ASCO|nr:Spo71 protein [Saccharomycopsis crataegensis]